MYQQGLRVKKISCFDSTAELRPVRPTSHLCLLATICDTKVSTATNLTPNWGFSPASLPSQPSITISSVEAGWIIEHRTEDSWKHWLPENPGGLMLNTNLQKLWGKKQQTHPYLAPEHISVQAWGVERGSVCFHACADPQVSQVDSSGEIEIASDVTEARCRLK